MISMIFLLIVCFTLTLSFSQRARGIWKRNQGAYSGFWCHRILHGVKNKGPTGEKPVGPKNTSKSCSQSRVGRKGFKSFLVCGQHTDAYPSALSVAVLRSPPKLNSFRFRFSTLRARTMPQSYFIRQIKSFEFMEEFLAFKARHPRWKKER
jgi:hypothetical protein